MKLYNSIGPNPHVVRMFIAELGLDIETVEVDLMSGENSCLLYTSPSPRDKRQSRMPSSA